MPHLPHTCCNQHTNLGDRVPHRARVRRLAKVTECCLPLALVLLLSPDVFELHVKVPELLGELRDVRAIVLLVGLGATDNNVEV